MPLIQRLRVERFRLSTQPHFLARSEKVKEEYDAIGKGYPCWYLLQLEFEPPTAHGNPEFTQNVLMDLNELDVISYEYIP